MTAKISTLGPDGFATKNLTTWAWSATYTGVSGGFGYITPDASFPSVTANAAYDLTASSFLYQVVQVPSGYTSATDPYVDLGLDSSTAGTSLRFMIKNGLLYCRLDVGYADGSDYRAFDPVAHAWLQIIEAAGQVKFQCSPTGAPNTWTTLRTVTTPAYATSVTPVFSAYTPAANGTFTNYEFDNVNNPPAGATTFAKAATLMDTFDASIPSATWALGGTATWVGGKVVLSALPGPTYSFARSVASFDLTDSYFVAECVAPALGTDDENTFIASTSTAGTDLRFLMSNGQLTAYSMVGGTDATGVSTPLVLNTDGSIWLRIRHDSTVGPTGTVFWEYSKTGVEGTYTILRNAPTPSWLTSTTGMTFSMQADNKDTSAPITGGTGTGSGSTGANAQVGAGAPPAGHSAAVDFRTLLRTLSPLSVGSHLSCYNGPNGTAWIFNSTWSTMLQGLGAMAWEIPLQWNGGSPVSSAGGGDRSKTGAQWINAVIAIGGLPVVIIGGTADNNFTNSDVTNLVNYCKALGVKYYVIGNEADNGGAGPTAAYMSALNGWCAAAKAADPTCLLGAPVSSHFTTAEAQTALQNASAYMDFVVYHAYDGENGLNAVSNYAQNVHAYRDTILNFGGSRAQSIGVGLGEFNWHFQSGDTAFLTWQNAVFTASVIGNTLSAEAYAAGSTYPLINTFAHSYSDSNGALGIANDGTSGLPGSQASLLPMGIGLGMWLGFNGTFRHYGTNLVGVVNNSLPSTIDVFATYDTVAGATHGYSGTKILVVDRGSATAQTISIALGGFSGSGTYNGYQTVMTTSGAMPNPTNAASGSYTSGVVTITVPPGTITSIELTS